MKVRIAARTSDLARVQAITVGNLLKLYSGIPDLEIQYCFKKSLGDLNQEDPLWKMPERGVFTEDFKADLSAGVCDLVVHSWKDLPVEDRAGSEIAATLPRADLRDILLFKNSSRNGLARGELRSVKILSSSPRRAYNLTPFLRDHLPSKNLEIEFVPVRGNIPTRLSKLIAGESDGLIVAKAALDRLLETTQVEWADVRSEIRKVLGQTTWMALPISANPPAAAQGALAIEIRSDRADLRGILSKIHCDETFRAVKEERKILKGYGGGCHQKIGVAVLFRPFGKVVSLQGQTDQGGLLSEFYIETRRELPKTAIEKIWPATEADLVRAFSRRPLPAGNPERDLWISKENALPSDWILKPEQIVWVSGLSTWKKLAARGVWVHGSAEGLGENECPRVDSILDRKTHFTKLGHSDGTQAEMPLLATYELKAEEVDPYFFKTLKDKTHFYWMSGSLFLYCLERVPSIRSAFHSCGPGNTAAVIRAELGKGSSVGIFTGIDEWRKEILT